MKLKYNTAIPILVFLLSSSVLLPREAFAIPAFSRQTGMACGSCHFQHFPTLNAFGRSFRSGGYTFSGMQENIEGENLSIPSVLNASVIGKLRYREANGDTGKGIDEGEIQWPDEAAILAGGRLAKDVGFLMELGLFGGEADTGSGAVTNVDGSLLADTGSGNVNTFLSSKVHFNVAHLAGAQLSIIPFSTDGLGAGYGMELMNTGAQRSSRPIENRTGFSAANALDLHGKATGVAFAATRHDFFVNYSPWVAGWNDANLSGIDSFAHYFRAAWMPSFHGWDTGIGFQIWNGDTEIAQGNGVSNEVLTTDAWVIDGQVQGSVKDMLLGIYASYGKCDSTMTHVSDTCRNVDDADSFGIVGQLGVLPNKANIYLAYRTLEDGSTINSEFDAWTLGANYMIAQNIRLELFHVAENGSGVDARGSHRDQTTTLQLFIGY